MSAMQAASAASELSDELPLRSGQVSKGAQGLQLCSVGLLRIADLGLSKCCGMPRKSGLMKLHYGVERPVQLQIWAEITST